MRVRWRLSLAAMVIFIVALSTVAVGAEGIFTPEEWTGGNGWCDGDICFRAWPVSSGVEVSWRVQQEPAPELRVLRLLSASSSSPTVIASSSGSGEFRFVDTDLQPGMVYVYELVAGEQTLGQPLEAGLAANANDPGGGSGNYRIYLPITLSN
ncbi:MAG: hypothetical protein ACUVWR_09135 [Anaerolineae bacterium]